eukprot:Awhi_evm1s4470
MLTMISFSFLFFLYSLRSDMWMDVEAAQELANCGIKVVADLWDVERNDWQTDESLRSRLSQECLQPFNWLQLKNVMATFPASWKRKLVAPGAASEALARMRDMNRPANYSDPNSTSILRDNAGTLEGRSAVVASVNALVAGGISTSISGPIKRKAHQKEMVSRHQVARHDLSSFVFGARRMQHNAIVVDDVYVHIPALICTITDAGCRGNTVEEARTIFNLVKKVLEAFEITTADVTQVNMQLLKPSDQPDIDIVYSEFFQELPARTVFYVSALPEECTIQMSFMARHRGMMAYSY